jgi:hypothetical protein
MGIGDMKHLNLGRPISISLGPAYRCKICGELLWTEKSPRTSWKEWLFTEDDRRHFKSRCNLKQQKK